MNLMVPNIANSNCLIFSLSGHLVDGKPESIDLVSSQSQIGVQRFLIKVSEVEQILSIGLGGGQNKTICYFSVVWPRFQDPQNFTPQYFSNDFVGIDSLLSQLHGELLNLKMRSAYILNMESSPPIIRVLNRLSSSQESGKVSMKLVGGSVAVSGSRLESFDWKVNEDSTVNLSLDFGLSVSLSNSFLNECWSESEKCLKQLTSGEGVNSV